MTELARLTPRVACSSWHRIGLSAAVLSRTGGRVYTIEIVPELAHRAEGDLPLGYKNVHLRIGDGYRGWPELARSTPSW